MAENTTENNDQGKAGAFVHPLMPQEVDKNTLAIHGNIKLELVPAVIKFFDNGLTGRVTKLLLQFNTWLSLWNEVVTAEALVRRKRHQ